MELLNIPYSLLLPVNSIFNAIDNLMELANHASIPMLDDQAINTAYNIFTQQPIFLQDLRAWTKKLAANKTWVIMKTHLREMQDNLALLPIAHSYFPAIQHANMAHLTNF